MDPDVAQVEQLLVAYGGYVHMTAEEIGADEMAMFLRADGAGVDLAFRFDHGHVFVAFPDGIEHALCLSVFDGAEVIEEHTEELEMDEEDGEVTFEETGGDVPRFFGPVLGDLARIQELDEAVWYVRRDGQEVPELALRLRDGRLYAGAGPSGSFSRVFDLIKRATEAEITAKVEEMLDRDAGEDV